jgi:cation transporter-like permease
MSTTTAPASVEGTNVVVMQTPTLQWALKRALLGLVILFVTIAAAATLLYASIDPDEEGVPSLTAPADTAPARFSAPPVEVPRRV